MARRIATMAIVKMVPECMLRIPKKLKKYIYLFILAFIFMIFVLLAQWQINRAHQKEALHQQRLAQAKLAPVDLASLSTIDPVKDRFLAVSLTGHYLTHFNFLLDNQQRAKKVGYRLLTPFKVSATKQIILINRHWLPRGILRSELPIITTPAHTLTLSGYLNSPATGILLGANIENDTWPLVIQKIDFELISTKVGAKVENYIVQLTPIDYIDIGSSKHWGYAVQWMALAAMAMVYLIFIVIKWN